MSSLKQYNTRPSNRWQLPISGTEFSTIALSLSAVTGLTHLFTSKSFLRPALIAVIAAHVLAIATRRMKWSIERTILVCTIGLVFAISWLVLPSTTLLGVPTPTTLSQTFHELSRAWETFQLVVAPAPLVPGFSIAVIVAGWLIAFVTDVAAFRARAPIEAGAPAAALFVFGAVLGQSQQTGTHRITTTLFLMALGGYWLLQQTHHHESSDSTLAFNRSSRSQLIIGAIFGAFSLAIAIGVGPSVPGMGMDAIIPWRDEGPVNNGSRVTVSPLVDIRSRIVNQSNVEAFTVQSEARSYWRLTALERFDGQIWSSEGRYNEESGDLPIAMRPTEPTANQTVAQHFIIKQLSSLWLPAAFQPTAIEGTSARWDPTSASLITDRPTANGQTYEVTSTLTSYKPNDLRAAVPTTPSSIKTTYLKLPSNFSTRLKDEAKRIVATAKTTYDQARLLQDYFRSDFTYDIDVIAGHAENLMERFVFETRRGYCEQFAGVYAAMARSIGLPARVAVGFTPGEEVSAGRYVVRGANGHAWPEVYLAGYGWVGFEPTPGRGIPNAEVYTGVVDPGQQSSTTPTTPTTAATPSTTVPGQGSVPNVAPRTQPSQADRETPRWMRILLVVGICGALFGLWIAGIAGVRNWRQRRRRALALDARDQVLVAWLETDEALARLGASRQSSETPLELAQRVGRSSLSARINSHELIDLAELATLATYGPKMRDEDLMPSAQWAITASEQLCSSINSTLATRERIMLLVDPRTLIFPHDR